jgi:hypothetical protein
MELKENETITLCRIKYNYCSCPEENLIDYIIVEDNGDRLLIRPLFWNQNEIAPVELVRDYMIEIQGTL